MTNVAIALTTIDDDGDPDALARQLVAERLAACVTVGAPATSHYRWKGTIERAVERQLLIKTTVDRLPALRRRLLELHRYELPEFLVLAVAEGSDAYLAWITDATFEVL
jgi:periplasmic divalent cation tolerance protein